MKGEWLDGMILWVFSNLSNSMILSDCLSAALCHTATKRNGILGGRFSLYRHTTNIHHWYRRHYFRSRPCICMSQGWVRDPVWNEALRRGGIFEKRQHKRERQPYRPQQPLDLGYPINRRRG